MRPNDSFTDNDLTSKNPKKREAQYIYSPPLQQSKIPINEDLIELMHEAVVVCDPEQHILLWNKSAEQLYKWTRQEAQGQLYHDMLKSQLQSDSEESLDALFTCEHWEGELRQVCQDGTSIIVTSRQTISNGVDKQFPCVLIANQISSKPKHIDPEQNNQLQLISIAREIGLWSWDLVNDQIIISMDAINREHPNTYTYLQYAQLIHPQDRHRINSIVQNALKTGMDYHAEYRRLTMPDRVERWIKIIGRIIKDNQGKASYVIGVATDITDQRNLQTKLKETNHHLQLVLETINDSFFFLDPQWNITYISRKAEGLVQQSQKELLGKNIWQALPYLEGSLLEHKIHEAVETQQTLQFENLFARDGHWYDFRLYPALEGLVVYGHDITEHKITKDALQASEAKFSWLLETNIMSVMIVDTEGNIHKANDAFLKLLGFTREDLDQGRINWIQQTAPEYREGDHYFMQELYNHTIFRPYEKEFYDKQGKRIPIMIAGALMESNSSLVTVLIIDISAQKQLEKQRETFISIVGHELRTPLTAINGSIQLAQRRLQRFMQKKQEKLEPESLVMFTKLDKLLEQSLRQTRVQNRLINDLLDISRLAIDKLELTLQPEDLLQIVKETIEDLRYTAGEHEIQLMLPDQKTILVLADNNRIGQVISNYVTNALKYSDCNEPITVEVTLEKNEARVWVHDKGPGLSEEDQKRIWESYYRTNNAKDQQGSGINLGLGLHICQILIQRHQGQVGVKSKEKEGSSFWFSLPIYAGEAFW